MGEGCQGCLRLSRLWCHLWSPFSWKLTRHILSMAGTGSSIENQVHLQPLWPCPRLESEILPKEQESLLLAKRYLIQWVLYSRFLQM